MKVPKAAFERAHREWNAPFTWWQRLCLRLAGLQPLVVEYWREQGIANQRAFLARMRETDPKEIERELKAHMN